MSEPATDEELNLAMAAVTFVPLRPEDGDLIRQQLEGLGLLDPAPPPDADPAPPPPDGPPPEHYVVVITPDSGNVEVGEFDGVDAVLRCLACQTDRDADVVVVRGVLCKFLPAPLRLVTPDDGIHPVIPVDPVVDPPEAVGRLGRPRDNDDPTTSTTPTQDHDDGEEDDEDDD